MTERHDNELRCVLNSLGECLAKVPEACQCKQMPETVYLDARKNLLWGVDDGELPRADSNIEKAPK